MNKFKFALIAALALALSACGDKEDTGMAKHVEVTGKVQSADAHASSECQPYDGVMIMVPGSGTVAQTGMDLAVPEEAIKSLKSVAEYGYTIKFYYDEKRASPSCPTKYYLMTSYEVLS